MKWIGLHFADIVEIQEAVTDELKKFQKRVIFDSFPQNVLPRKGCIYANGAYFEWKKVCVFLMCLRFLKKSVLKLLDRTV